MLGMGIGYGLENPIGHLIFQLVLSIGISQQGIGNLCFDFAMYYYKKREIQNTS